MWTTLNLISLVIGIIVIVIGVYVDKKSDIHDHSFLLFLFFGVCFIVVSAVSASIQLIAGLF